MARPVLSIAAATAVICFASLSAPAASVIEEWAQVKVPAAPALKPVTLDSKTTALLMLDFMNQNCGQRPRCLATIPAMKALLEKARAAKATVVYSITSNTTAADVIKDIAPVAGEPAVRAPPDKFHKSDLEKNLADKGIRTVIVAGTAAHGAVLFTANGAALRGLNVIVPVDGMSALDAFTEAYVIVHVTTAPGIAPKATLTRSDMISFQ
jgi:nicotinamidase-related amidase